MSMKKSNSLLPDLGRYQGKETLAKDIGGKNVLGGYVNFLR